MITILDSTIKPPKLVLFRVHDLEVQLESLCEVEDRDLTSDLQQQLTSDLKVIKVNLDACNDCWDSLDDLDGHTRDVHQGLFLSTYILQPYLQIPNVLKATCSLMELCFVLLHGCMPWQEVSSFHQTSS